jgi:hypothetical protein
MLNDFAHYVTVLIFKCLRFFSYLLELINIFLFHTDFTLLFYIYFTELLVQSFVHFFHAIPQFIFEEKQIKLVNIVNCWAVNTNFLNGF